MIALATRITPEDRADLARKLAALRPTRRKRSLPRKSSRVAIERAGLARLTDRDPEPAISARWIVRIFYRSMGGEILACDSAPLTWSARDALASQMRACTSDALGCDVLLADGSHTGTWSDRDSARRADLSNARAVTLPSQMRQGTARGFVDADTTTTDRRAA